MRVFTSILLVLALATVSVAGQATTKQPFANMSAASGAVKTSAILNMTGAKTKTLHVSGTTRAGAFKNMSGTLIAQCAPSTSGPWSTCVANDYAQTAVSRTTNGSFTWSDVSGYVRLQWTGSTVETWLKAWVSYMDGN